MERQLTVAVLGASTNREKYGNKAVRAYRQAGYKVFPVNPRADVIEGIKCYPSLLAIPETLDRVSVYLPPALGVTALDEIAKKGVKELYINPGAESDDLVSKAKSLGLEPILACSIAEIGMSPGEFE